MAADGDEGDSRLDLGNRCADAITAASTTVADSQVLVESSVARREGTMTKRCAWCERYLVAGRWLSLPPLLARTRVGSTHGICPDCVDKLRGDGQSV
jgi:hypothetical protein